MRQKPTQLPAPKSSAWSPPLLLRSLERRALRHEDRKRRVQSHRPKLGRAEEDYGRSLSFIASHVRKIIEVYEPFDLKFLAELTEMLKAYSVALKPWTART